MQIEKQVHVIVTVGLFVIVTVGLFASTISPIVRPDLPILTAILGLATNVFWVWGDAIIPMVTHIGELKELVKILR